MGWFGFLIRHWVRPYLPLVYPGRRVHGFSFDGDPGRVAGERRHLTTDGRVYRRHLASLAWKVSEASRGAVINRLGRIYDTIYIDEVQDLCGWDLELLRLMMSSPIILNMVGDVRQALLATNPQEAKNKRFMYSRILDWFKDEEAAGRLTIQHESTTWRCNSPVARFADTIFGDSWGFGATVSRNHEVTDHDGVFIIGESDVEAYIAEYRPLCLRQSKSSWKHLELELTTFGLVKGLTSRRVVVFATKPIEDFLATGKLLSDSSACGLYVATTRAQASVAFAVKKPERCSFPIWRPGN